MLDYPEYNFLETVSVLYAFRPKFYTEALCKQKSTNDFFPGRGQSAKVRLAATFCRECPVQFECHEYAIDNKIEHGVWGGSTPDQRNKWIQNETTVEQAWEELENLK